VVETIMVRPLDLAYHRPIVSTIIVSPLSFLGCTRKIGQKRTGLY